jgi:hypothetical protein
VDKCEDRCLISNGAEGNNGSHDTGGQPGMTKEMYEEMASTMLPLLAKRPGCIAHAAWPVEGGWQVMEIGSLKRIMMLGRQK